MIKSAPLDSTSVLLIDIGEGLSYDLITFKHKSPYLPSCLVLQEFQQVIQDIKDLPSGIKIIEYNFFIIWLIQGARAYYFYIVLYDWLDVSCHQILSRVAKAMDLQL